MSEFVECTTKIKSRIDLVEALIEVGFKREEIEVHEEAQHLYGFQNDKRPEKANVILRRKFVGGASNDIGFMKKKDGTYEFISSAYDRGSSGKHAGHTRGYNDAWLKDITQKYTEKLYTRTAKMKGYEVRKTVEGKKIVLTLIK